MTLNDNVLLSGVKYTSKREAVKPSFVLSPSQGASEVDSMIRSAVEKDDKSRRMAVMHRIGDAGSVKSIILKRQRKKRRYEGEALNKAKRLRVREVPVGWRKGITVALRM